MHCSALQTYKCWSSETRLFASLTTPSTDSHLFFGSPKAWAMLTVVASKKWSIVYWLTWNGEVLNTCHINNKHSLYSNSKLVSADIKQKQNLIVQPITRIIPVLFDMFWFRQRLRKIYINITIIWDVCLCNIITNRWCEKTNAACCAANSACRAAISALCRRVYYHPCC